MEVKTETIIVEPQRMKLWELLLAWGKPWIIDEIQPAAPEIIDTITYNLIPYELDLVLHIIQGEDKPYFEATLIDGDGKIIEFPHPSRHFPSFLKVEYKDTQYEFKFECEDLDDHGTIAFDETQIRIFNGAKKEVVMWTTQEWIDDPEVVFSITNAVKIALTKGTRVLESMIAK